MISIHDVSFHYKAKKSILEQITVDLYPGKIYGLLGLNGTGKSTLLRLLQGWLFAKNGTIKVCDHQPTDRKATFLQQIFMVSEDQPKFSGSLRKFEQIYAPFYPEFDVLRFRDVLQQFGLEGSARFSTLSTGQTKKAWLSFALATNCPVLLLDEPTNGLDIPSKATFRRLMADSISDDRIILIATHQIRDVHNLLDHLLILQNGKIGFDQSLDEISQNFRFEVTSREPLTEEVLYYERVPGGFLRIAPGGAYEQSLDPELEILFNGIIQKPEAFIPFTKKSNSHA